VDIYSTKVPVILIVVLLGILVLQYVSNDSSGSKLIDSETCELYTQDLQTILERIRFQMYGF